MEAMKNWNSKGYKQMPELRIYRGPQATGKSTAAMELVKDGWMRVNKDSLRARYPHLSEREIHQTVMHMHDVAAREQWNIVNDNVNLSDKTVAGYKAWAQRNNYTVTEQLFGADLDMFEAIYRDRKRGENGGHSVGRSVITQSYMDFGLFKQSAFNLVMWDKVVLIDIDGTLANIEHRRHHLQGDKKDWQLFFADMQFDTVNETVARAMQVYARAGYTIILMSGRPANYRALTENWLCDNGLDSYFALFMRPFNDSRQDYLIKQELYAKYIQPYFTVEVVLDDRPQVLRMWRSIGLPTFQVGDGTEF
jgi:predicted ABC-type ATPase